jgi:hypothetical protein
LPAYDAEPAGAANLFNPTVPAQCRYFDKCTNRNPRLNSFGTAAWIPSAVPWSGRFMCAKMIEPGLLLSIAVTTWAAE